MGTSVFSQEGTLTVLLSFHFASAPDGPIVMSSQNRAVKMVHRFHTASVHVSCLFPECYMPGMYARECVGFPAVLSTRGPLSPSHKQAWAPGGGVFLRRAWLTANLLRPSSMVPLKTARVEDTWRQTSPLLVEELVCPGHITSAREAQGCPLSPSSFPLQHRCLWATAMGLVSLS